MKILLVVTLFYLGFVAIATAAVATILWSLRRRNRVSATTKTQAPVTWLVSPRSPARMHRRLRNALCAARAAYAPDVGQAHPQLPDLALSLEREAVLTDDLIVAASITPRPHRRQTLRPLQAQVAEIERLAHQIAHTARRTGPSAIPPAADGLRDVADQLAALHAAQSEVDELDRLVQGHPQQLQQLQPLPRPDLSHLPPPPLPQA